MSITGGLYNARNQESMTDSGITVTAADAGTGVARIALVDNGATRWISGRESTDLCPSNACSNSASWSYTLDPASLGWATGTHELRLIVWDAAGNASTTIWVVNYYTASWAYGGDNHSFAGSVEGELEQFDDDLADVETEDGTESLIDELAPADRVTYVQWVDALPGWDDDGEAQASGPGPLNQCRVYLKRSTSNIPKKRLRWEAKQDCGILDTTQVGGSSLRLNGTSDVRRYGTPCIAVPGGQCISTAAYKPQSQIAHQYYLAFWIVDTFLTGDVWQELDEHYVSGFDSPSACMGLGTYVLSCTFHKVFTF